jgi:hypothetical protein
MSLRGENFYVDDVAWEIINKLFEKQDAVVSCDVYILWRCGGVYITRAA